MTPSIGVSAVSLLLYPARTKLVWSYGLGREREEEEIDDR